MEIKIINALPEHVKKIREISQELKFNQEKPKCEALITVLREREYTERTRLSKYFYVAVEGQIVLGFLMAFDDKTYEELLRRGLFHHEEIIPFLNDSSKPFVYWESFGVANNKQRAGVGKALINRLLEDGINDDKKIIHAMIRHEPYKNNASINLTKQFGFQYSGIDVSNEEYTHGIYQKTL